MKRRGKYIQHKFESWRLVLLLSGVVGRRVLVLLLEVLLFQMLNLPLDLAVIRCASVVQLDVEPVLGLPPPDEEESDDRGGECGDTGDRTADDST
jgi:hypothetical protein